MNHVHDIVRGDVGRKQVFRIKTEKIGDYHE